MIAVISFRLTVVNACVKCGQPHHVYNNVFLFVKMYFQFTTDIPFNGVTFGLKQPLY